MHQSDIRKLRKDLIWKASSQGQTLTFHTTWGLFSPREIDEGSAFLLKYVSVQPDSISLDLGCGYGAIGLFLAKQSPRGKVHLVDTDFVAEEYAARNAARNHLHHVEAYLSNGLKQVPEEIIFDTVVSNIPAKVGRELLQIFFFDAKDHLKKGGKIYVVTVNGLRDFVKRHFKDIFGNYEKIKQGKTHTVAMAIKE